MQDFEKLGVFYLGRSYDAAEKRPRDDLILYDSRDLVTHAVCLGMTGSGKTGLCLSILEEAAIDGIPVLAIDPKGDLPNLLLTFPKLRGSDFAPWVNTEDARKAGLSNEEYAAAQARLWKNGLAEWGQDGARIQRLRDAADFVIYTPGSTAGLPISVFKSLAAPEQALVNDSELFRERVSGMATSLLALLGIDADPVQSREHILISTILSTAWKQGQSLDLPALIQQIQAPPLTRVGVLDLDSFFPAKDRFALAMAFNNLLAAPASEAWLQGEPLDVAAFLHTPAGKPRVSIFSIAHLNDTERMFFVSMLLNEVVSWMRAQPGTSSLRALVYMDEIAGYFPPVANPPSKAPLLTLLKQARAFGVGLMLATQNPVDIDYKGLSNAGTWFLGRLQTERDQARILDGLEGAASGSFNRRDMEKILSGLGKRVFLMHNVHEDGPELFQVRWAMSYLRGPLTRSQIKVLMEQRATEETEDEEEPAPPSAAKPVAKGESGTRPLLPPEVPQYFVPVNTTPPAGSSLIYRPMILGCAQIHFSQAKGNVDTNRSVALLTDAADSLDWQNAAEVEWTEADLVRAPDDDALFANLPAAAAKGKSYDAWKKTLATALYRGQRLELLLSDSVGVYSRPDETERDFRVRLKDAAREERDLRAEKLRHKYAPKIAALEDRIRRAKQAVDREQDQASQSRLQTAISFGATVLGAFLGRKKLSAGTVGKAATTARGVGRSAKEAKDVARAEETVKALEQQLADLEAEFQEELTALESAVDPLTEKFETVVVKPKKTDVSVSLVTLLWLPAWQQPDGSTVDGWE
ncbi:MAG: ATP-binding protein [Gemmataceae bacterium]